MTSCPADLQRGLNIHVVMENGTRFLNILYEIVEQRLPKKTGACEERRAIWLALLKNPPHHTAPALLSGQPHLVASGGRTTELQAALRRIAP